VADIEKFAESRPRMSLRTDVRIKKEVKVVSDFSETFQAKVEQVQGELKPLNRERHEATVEATKTASSFTSISKFLTNQHKLDIQYIGSNANFEDTKAPTYKPASQIRELLPKIQVAAEYASSALLKRKTRTFDKDGEIVEQTEDSDKTGFLSAKGETYLLNATLFPRLTSHNPIERDDKGNYERFQNSEQFKSENAPLASSLRYLDKFKPETSAQMTQVLQKVLDRNKKYNVQFEDQFMANNVEKTEVNIGFDDIFRTPEIYKNLTEQERFMVVFSAFDNVMRFHKSFSDIYGVGPKATLGGDAKAKVDIKAESQKSLDRAKKWFTHMKENVEDPTMLLAVGLTEKISGTISRQINWGDMNISAKESKEFDDPRVLMVDGYFNYFEKEYAKEFKSAKTITFDDILSDNERLSKQIWSALGARGYIDETGKISNSFDVDNPSFKLNLGLDPAEEERVQAKLRGKFLGDFSFEGSDIAVVNESEKQSQKVKNHKSGKYEDLGTILTGIGKGKDWKDKINSSLSSYDTLLGIYRNVTGAKDNVMTTDVQGVVTEGGGFKVKISEDGKWNQKQPSDGVTPSSWQTVSGQPLEIEFKTKNDAQKFADKLLYSIQLMAPIVGMFAPTKAPVLMDNPDKTGTLVISRRVDYDHEIFEKPQKTLKGSIEEIMVQEGFGKISINKLQYRQFQDKVAKWEEKEEQHYADEFERVSKENEILSNEKNEQRRIDQEVQKRRQEERAQAVKQENEAAARNNASKGQDKKDDKE
jgi:hypothetical protein